MRRAALDLHEDSSHPETRNVSLQALCVEKFGRKHGAIVAARVAQWAVLTAELKRVPMTREYVDWWALDERTGWRHRAAIRAALGEDWKVVVERLAVEIVRHRARSPRALERLTHQLSVAVLAHDRADSPETQ